MNKDKLTQRQLHLLNLIYRDRDINGWAKVSKVILPALQTGFPQDLIRLEPFDDGSGRARLTETGLRVVEVQKYFV